MSEAAPGPRRGTDVTATEWKPADRARLVLSLVLLVVGAGYLVTALQLPMEQRERPGAGVFPVIAVSTFLLCLMIDVARPVVARSRGAWEHGTGRPHWRVAFVLGIVLMYVLIDGVVGHLISTALVAAGIVIVFGRRPWWQVVIVAAVAGLGTDYLFSELLGVPLDTGMLEIGVSEWT